MGNLPIATERYVEEMQRTHATLAKASEIMRCVPDDLPDAIIKAKLEVAFMQGKIEHDLIAPILSRKRMKKLSEPKELRRIERRLAEVQEVLEQG